MEKSKGASRFKVTSSRERASCERAFSKFSRRLPLISSMLSKIPSIESYCWINCAAVFKPIFLTPGTLSEVSPIKARVSTTWDGFMPFVSSSDRSSIILSLWRSSIVTRSPINNCSRSLSLEIIVTSISRASGLSRIARVTEAMISSASNSGRPSVKIPNASSNSMMR